MVDHGKRETSADVGLSRRGPIFQPLWGIVYYGKRNEDSFSARRDEAKTGQLVSRLYYEVDPTGPAPARSVSERSLEYIAVGAVLHRLLFVVHQFGLMIDVSVLRWADRMMSRGRAKLMNNKQQV